ncbi:MAG: aminopeptidase P family protein [Deltaproteobacteria bacterium]|jgi:Xaa-Pro aminopeptidase|nr:aminopeptidase P family protein [Deltaproteobacteria bacterium]
MNPVKPLEKIRAILRRKKADAFLVTQPENRRYLSGYTAIDHSISESSGVLLIPVAGIPLLLTDSRYYLQACKEANGYKVILVRTSLVSSIKQVLPQLGVRRLLFESHYVLHSTAVKLEELGRQQNMETVPVHGMVEKLRTIKTPGEVEKIRKAVALNERVFQEIYGVLAPGQSEKEVAVAIESAMMLKGADGPAFPTIVASGVNAAGPHAVPTDKIIKEGETITIDMGLKLNGYCSDMTRTVVLGRTDKRTREILTLVRRAQLSALKTIRAGILASEADRAARKIINEAGFGRYFGHGLGHGVGLAVHEAPYLNRKRRNQLRAGMVVTVEPGIYIPGWGGVRLENMVVVEEGGCRNLNRDTTFLDL